MKIFKLQDDIFNNLITDSTFCNDILLTDTSDMTKVKEKVRTTFGNPLLLDVNSDTFPFIEFSFTAGVSSSNNFLLDKAPLQFRIYYLMESDKVSISEDIDAVIKDKYNYLPIISQYDYETGVKDIYCWRMVYKPFVFS